MRTDKLSSATRQAGSQQVGDAIKINIPSILTLYHVLSGRALVVDPQTTGVVALGRQEGLSGTDEYV